jgi:hypothetical protein
MKIIFATVFLIVLSADAYANEFATSNNINYEITYTQKTEVLTANPGDWLFSFKDRHKTSKDKDLQSSDRYEFIGRTGDKAFQIKHTSKLMDVSSSDKVLNMYFEENSTFPMVFHASYSSCEYGSIVQLQMLELKGNQLVYKLIYPECLKKK